MVAANICVASVCLSVASVLPPLLRQQAQKGSGQCQQVLVVAAGAAFCDAPRKPRCVSLGNVPHCLDSGGSVGHSVLLQLGCVHGLGHWKSAVYVLEKEPHAPKMGVLRCPSFQS